VRRGEFIPGLILRFRSSIAWHMPSRWWGRVMAEGGESRGIRRRAPRACTRAVCFTHANTRARARDHRARLFIPVILNIGKDISILVEHTNLRSLRRCTLHGKASRAFCRRGCASLRIRHRKSREENVIFPVGSDRNFFRKLSRSEEQAPLRRPFACRYRRGARRADRKWSQFET